VKEIILRLSDKQAEKLELLANFRSREEKRRVRPEECLVRFIETSQPGGHWEHPEKATKAT
jgi:hypothetical protein